MFQAQVQPHGRRRVMRVITTVVFAGLATSTGMLLARGPDVQVRKVVVPVAVVDHAAAIDGSAHGYFGYIDDTLQVSFAFTPSRRLLDAIKLWKPALHGTG